MPISVPGVASREAGVEHVSPVWQVARKAMSHLSSFNCFALRGLIRTGASPVDSWTGSGHAPE